MFIIKFLFIILSAFLVLVVLLGSGFVRLISNLFSGPKKTTNNRGNYQQQNRTRQQSSQQTKQEDDKKIISSDEGEYVDFEEIKD